MRLAGAAIHELHLARKVAVSKVEIKASNVTILLISFFSPGAPHARCFGFDRMPFRSGLQTICHQYGQDLPESPENRYHVRQI